MKKLAQKRSEEKDAQLRKLAQRVIDEKERMAVGETETEGETEGRRQRETLRDERKRERERDYRIAMAAPEKRNKLMRDRDRDVSHCLCPVCSTAFVAKTLPLPCVFHCLRG